MPSGPEFKWWAREDSNFRPRLGHFWSSRHFQGQKGPNFPWWLTASKVWRLALTYGNAYAGCMTSMNASEAREKLYRLLDETASHHEPVLITGPRSNAVLVGEEDWNSIQETLYLLSVL